MGTGGRGWHIDRADMVVRAMTDTLFSELSDSGWLLNNLYQLDDGSWRCNLRRPDGLGDYFTDWAEGPTLEAALASAMGKFASAEYIEAHAITFAIDKSKPVNPLLSLLGLGRQAQAPMRRL